MKINSVYFHFIRANQFQGISIPYFHNVRATEFQVISRSVTTLISFPFFNCHTAYLAHQLYFVKQSVALDC